MQSKIKIFESGIADGVMSRNKKFYSSNFDQDQIDKMFLQTRENLGKKYGFDGKKIFQASQKTESNNIKYQDGKFIILDDKNMTKEDFWYEDLPADILIISRQYPNIVVGNQMADCPVLIIEDRKHGVTALSHCGASYINRNLPYATVNALYKNYNSTPDDLYAYIGSCAKKESYVYDKYPAWATNTEVWKDYITKIDNNYYIDMPGAMVSQLKKAKIKHIRIINKDTVTDNIHYSHIASLKGDTKKLGQNFVGFYYLDEK